MWLTALHGDRFRMELGSTFRSQIFDSLAEHWDIAIVILTHHQTVDRYKWSLDRIPDLSVFEDTAALDAYGQISHSERWPRPLPNDRFQYQLAPHHSMLSTQRNTRTQLNSYFAAGSIVWPRKCLNQKSFFFYFFCFTVRLHTPLANFKNWLNGSWTRSRRKRLCLAEPTQSNLTHTHGVGVT